MYRKTRILMIYPIFRLELPVAQLFETLHLFAEN